MSQTLPAVRIFVQTFVAVLLRAIHISAFAPRLLSDIDRFHVAIVPAGYEIRNALWITSCV